MMESIIQSLSACTVRCLGLPAAVNESMIRPRLYAIAAETHGFWTFSRP